MKASLSPEEISQELKDERSLVWVDLLDMDDNDVDLLTMVFNLHPLTVEDFIMPNARPKLEHLRDYLFMIMFSMEPECNGTSKGRCRTIELDCCLGKNFLITFHTQPIAPLSVCKERIRKQSPIIMHGADMLLYSVIDACVDAYMPIISDFDSLVDAMSDELFKDPDQETLHKIYTLKNDTMLLRRTIGPQADMLSLLARGDSEFISRSNTIYFRNICDNLLRLNDVVGTSRDVITGAMEAYVSIISNRLNEIMKTLTVIATIMMPLTLIASIYGMNFKHMPELEAKWGYPMVWLVMLVLGISMSVYFKRKKWL